MQKTNKINIKAIILITIVTIKTDALNSLTIETAIQLGEEKLFEMGQKGHMYVNDKYDYSKVGMKNKQLYQWILGENPDFTLLYK